MRNKTMRLFIVVCIMAVSQLTNAQNSQIGIGIGGSTYTGDMDAPKVFDNIGLTETAFQIYFSYFVNPKVNLRLNFLRGGLKGDDSRSTADWQLRRNLNFETPLTEYSLLAEYNVFDILSNQAKRRFTPFVSVGIAIFQFDPSTSYLDTDGTTKTVKLQPLGTEGQGLVGYAEPYSLSQFSVPIGGGIKYALSENLTLSIEMFSRFTFTDYIDDLSTNYPALDDLLSKGEAGLISSYLSNRQDEFLGLPQNDTAVDSVWGGNRGDSTTNDYYFGAMINIAYRLNGGLFSRGSGAMGCPSF